LVRVGGQGDGVLGMAMLVGRGSKEGKRLASITFLVGTAFCFLVGEIGGREDKGTGRFGM